MSDDLNVLADDCAAEARTFLRESRGDIDGEMTAEAELRCWADLCHSLLASSEFLMRL